MSKTMQLSHGQVAIVDDADYEWLSQWKWRAWWCEDTRSYYAIRRPRVGNNKRALVLMHRLILGLTKGDGKRVDHVHPEHTLDNQRSNLRIATPSQNQANRGKQCNNTSGFKGVHFFKRDGKWQAFISSKRKRYHLGYFDTPTAAYVAYCQAAERLHGEFRRVS